MCYYHCFSNSGILVQAEGALRDLKYFSLTKKLRRIRKFSAREKSQLSAK